jgi:hypothetical protein
MIAPNPKVLNKLKPSKEQLEIVYGEIMNEVNDLRLQIDNKKPFIALIFKAKASILILPRQLQEELTEFNCVRYRTLPAIASRVRNVLRSSKKVSMTPIDHINQQAVATYVREAIWPGNKSFQRVGVSGGMIKEVCVI